MHLRGETTIISNKWFVTDNVIYAFKTCNILVKWNISRNLNQCLYICKNDNEKGLFMKENVELKCYYNLRNTLLVEENVLKKQIFCSKNSQTYLIFKSHLYCK